MDHELRSPEIAAPDPSDYLAPITAHALAAALAGPLPPTVIDVRSLDEFFDDPLGRVPGALVVPLEHLSAEAENLQALGTALVLCCRTDPRALEAAKRLRARGLSQLRVLAGGIVAWRAAGLPVEREGTT